MRWSRAFLPVLKESPADAQIVSHKLMLRAGLVRQTAAGIYAWLPLGFRVLQKIEQIVREEQNRAGAQEIASMHGDTPLFENLVARLTCAPARLSPEHGRLSISLTSINAARERA